MLDYSYVALGVIALCTVLGMAYYATKILLQMRTGELEKSWKYLVAGAYLIETAVFMLLVAEVLFQESAYTTVLVTHLAVTMLVVGAVYMLLGFRAHHRVFSPRPELKMQDIIEQ